MPKVGDVVAGKYEIEKVIGEGGMGAVFSAMHKLTAKRVALKWMLPELARDEDAVQRFMREAQAAGRINHPNVVDVYDVGQHEESFFLVMEFLQGEPLTAALERRNLSVGEILDLILPAIRGVAAAHRQGVVHRDLKPDNIFLSRDEDAHAPVPKVLDFGISKMAGNEGAVNPRLTKTGAVVGTPYYMCPEAIRGSNNVDKRADVYAFGVILYEALTGQVPFNADTYSALILEIATGTAKPPHEIADIPAELSDIVQRAMARDLTERFADLETLATALEPFAATAGRQERRDPTGSTRIPTQGVGKAKPMADTVTPFVASERPVVPRKSSSSYTLIAVAAGLAIAIGAWLMSRGPAQTAEEHVVSPAAPAPRAAAAVPAPPAAPEPAPAPAAAAEPPTVVAQPQPAAESPAEAGPSVVAAPEAAPSAAEATDAKRNKHNRHPGAAAAPAAVPTPAPSPAPRQRASGARSGTISVDDF